MFSKSKKLLQDDGEEENLSLASELAAAGGRAPLFTYPTREYPRVPEITRDCPR